VDQPDNTSKYTADLFATFKNNGRILDDVRFEDPTFKEAIVKIQRWLARH
jgi:hypothetical protein